MPLPPPPAANSPPPVPVLTVSGPAGAKAISCSQPAIDAAEYDEDRPRQVADGNVKAPDTALLDAELQDAIERAIQELPEVQRMAVIMRRCHDVSYEEIAEVLEITVPAVKSILFRARTELREKLGAYLRE